jgi:type I restriction enzyme S subunit
MNEPRWEVVHLDNCIAEGRPICYGILMPGQGHPGGVPVVKVKDIKGGRILLDNILLTSPEIDAQYRRSRVRAGDVLLTIRGTTGRLARVPTVLDGANITQDTARVTPRPGVCGDFMFFALQSEELQSQIKDHTRGQAVKGINIADVRRLRLLLPPLGEQKKIAAILSCVDDAIDATRSVIDQLQVVKKAMMAELLTRGLPGRHTRFKMTEIGEVPETWHLVCGEELFKLSGGYGPSDVTFSPTGSALFLKVDDFNLPANQRGLCEAALRFDSNTNAKIKTYEPGALVFPKRGAAIFKNRVQLLRRTATVDPNLMVLLPGPRLDPAFFAYEMLQIGLYNLSDNSGIPQLNNKHLYPHPFLVPPLDEQVAVRTALEEVDRRLDAEGESNRALLSVKFGLMAVLLTGEVRVKPAEDAA